MLEQFMRQFTEEKISFHQLRSSYYSIPDRLLPFERLKPFSLGLPLGEQRGKTFVPSLPLLTWLAKRSSRKVFLTDKGAWRFLNGKDVSSESISRRCANGVVLVQNKHDENLGYGILSDTGVKNLLDRGDYLRRERKESKAL